jgi:hypothetical protein
VSVLGEEMTAGELTEWAAFEQTFGSILPHERIDAGVAQISFILAQAFSKPGRRWRIRDFMPQWYRDLTADRELARGMEMMRTLVSEEPDDADG